MTIFIFFIIALGASILGATGGIGGGVLMRPIIDATGLVSVATATFLTNTSGLVMSATTVLLNFYLDFRKRKKTALGGEEFEEAGADEKTQEQGINLRISVPLAVGAAGGGILGGFLFELLNGYNPTVALIVQASMLIGLLSFTLIYLVFQNKIKSRNVKHFSICAIIGLVLGITSSFIGIGGGHFNIAVLIFFFGMNVKTAAKNSLFVIFFSKLTNLIFLLSSGSVPEFLPWVLVVIIVGSIVGGFSGKYLQTKLSEKKLNVLLIVILVGVIGVSVFNVVRASVGRL